MRTSPIAAAAASMLVLGALGCQRGESKPEGKPMPSAAPAVASATASAAPAAPAAPPYGPREVAEGWLEGGAFTGKFTVVRQGEQGLSHRDAIAACTSAGKALCTDTQWARACAADASLGALTSWTASGVGGGRFVVRGGGECSARRLEAETATDPTRVAICCDRAPAITTGNKNLAFVRAVSEQLVRYEKALRERSYAGLESIYEAKVTFDGKEYPREKLIQRHRWDFGAHPQQWMLFDLCEASILKEGDESFLQADCRTLFDRSKGTKAGLQRFVWGGPERRLQQVGAARRQKAAGSTLEFEGEPETTEAIGVLLMAD